MQIYYKPYMMWEWDSLRFTHFYIYIVITDIGDHVFFCNIQPSLERFWQEYFR